MTSIQLTTCDILRKTATMRLAELTTTYNFVFFIFLPKFFLQFSSLRNRKFFYLLNISKVTNVNIYNYALIVVRNMIKFLEDGKFFDYLLSLLSNSFVKFIVEKWKYIKNDRCLVNFAKNIISSYQLLSDNFKLKKFLIFHVKAIKKITILHMIWLSFDI